MPGMTSCHARDDVMSRPERHHCHARGDMLRIVRDTVLRVGSFGWSLPILQLYVCVGQSGRIQLIDVAHIGGLV